MLHLIFILLAFITLAACEGDSSQKGDGSRESAAPVVSANPDSDGLSIEGIASCRYAMGPELALCINIPSAFSADQLANSKSACDPARGYEWIEEACPSANVIGACDKAAGSRNFGAGIVQYYYNPPFGSADARGMCEANGGNFQ